MKIYISNISKQNIGGGYSFLNNFKKALKDKVEFVDRWQDCDIIFVFGITTMDKGEIHEAVKNGKKLVLRCDNIPRKSRNPRMSPVERLKEFGNMADAVIYQSEWCRLYVGYFIDNANDFIIYNGTDKEIFNEKDISDKGSERLYLYLNFNDNPNKRFDEALYRFDMAWRINSNSKLIIAGNAPKIYTEHPEYNWDLTVPAEVEYVGVLETPEKVAEVMKKCDFILIPYFAEANSNVLNEALNCGLEPIAVCEEGGNIEVMNRFKEGIMPSIQNMGQEYLNIFNVVLNN